VIDPKARLTDIGERGLLEHLRSRIPVGDGVVVGIGDDAAAVLPGSGLTLVTTDSMVEGVHFTREWSPPVLVGRKALSINLSDIGAMGGVSRHAVVSLCLPPDVPVAFVDELYDGLLERTAEANVGLIGGNVAATRGPVVIDITLLGHGEKLLRRNGARPGDKIVVTGSLGAAAAGLLLLRQGARLTEEGQLAATGIWTDSSRDAVIRCLRAQLDPTPPLAIGRALVDDDMARAAIDISDGLSSDLRRVCEESGVGARVLADLIPVDAAAQGLARAQGGDAFPLALHGGEDYQLLIAVPPERIEDVVELGRVWNMPMTAVGEFTEGSGIVLEQSGGRGVMPLVPAGYDHFRGQDGGA
jgi:thiamine-monophosphate kinase